MEFCQTMSLPTAQLDAEIESVMDVDEWMRYSALTVLCGIYDTFVMGGLRHNIRVFAPESGSGGVVALPWDNDFVFNAGTTSSMRPMTGNLQRVIDLPRFRRLYWGHVQDLVNTTFNAPYMNDWLTHYGGVMGANLSGQAAYITARGNHALSQLPAQVAFGISTNGGADFSIDSTLATLEGQGWINVREFRLAGSADPLGVEWLDNDSWRIQLPLMPGANPINLEVYDFSGILIETASLTITSTASEPQPFDFLRITELNYNPDGDDGPEFIELKNIGPQALDISGVTFTDGVAFVVPDLTILASGAFAVVVRDQLAFEGVYGTGLPVIGEYAPNALKNGGERIELRDAVGNVLSGDRWRSLYFGREGRRRGDPGLGNCRGMGN